MMKRSLCLVVLSISICCGWQEPKTYTEWVSEGLALAGSGHYEAAARAFRYALAAASDSGVGKQQAVRIMSALASADADADQYLEAEQE